MIGRLEFVPGGRGRSVMGELYGLPVLRTGADPKGRLGKYWVRRAGQALKKGGAVRTLLPAGFGEWELLGRLGLKNIDPAPLLRVSAPELAVRALRERDVDPEGATVVLSGWRVDEAMFRCAARLCPRVRRIAVSAGGGERLAQRLREEFGMPVLPSEHPAQLELRFQPVDTGREEPHLELYGSEPDLDGLKLSVPGLEEADREALDVLTLLWERGKLPLSDIKINRN